MLLLYFTVQKRYSSIHDAVAHGDVNALETMVKSGASINEVDDKDKFTPLHTACNVGALEVTFPDISITNLSTDLCMCNYVLQLVCNESKVYLSQPYALSNRHMYYCLKRSSDPDFCVLEQHLIVHFLSKHALYF